MSPSPDRTREAIDLALYGLRRIADADPLAADRDVVAELTARRRYAMDIWRQVRDMTGGQDDEPR